MKNDKPLFIKTRDADTAKLLKAEGFELLEHTNNVWTFVNDPNRPITFENNKVTYTNILTF